MKHWTTLSSLWLSLLTLLACGIIGWRRPKENVDKLSVVYDVELHARHGFAQACQSSVTITTAYYNLLESSKYSAVEYSDWNQRFFRLADNMVIFTDANTLKDIHSLRRLAKGCTLIVLQNLNETKASMLTDWERQYAIDHEKHHSPALYIIWAQKAFWLASVARVNPFRSSYFFWADAGQFRDDRFQRRYLSNPWTKWVRYTNFIPRNRVAFLSIEPFTEDELQLHTDGFGPILSSALVRLGGGNFGGDARAVSLFAHLYSSEFHRYLQAGAFVGKDQPIFGSICITYSTACYIVDSRKVKKIADPWFAMQPVLHGVSKPVPGYILHPSVGR